MSPAQARPWAIRLALADAQAAGALRLRAGVEVLVQRDIVWIRGGPLDDEVETELRKLPCLARYAVLPDEGLVAWEERIPSGRLPEGRWTPIAAWLKPSPQDAVGPGAPPPRVTPGLVRDAAEREAAILVVREEALAAWAETAPASRLKPLAFALCEDGRVLVKGRPLPPLPGARYAEEGGIAVPCGWAFQPRVDAAVMREVLGLAHGDLALFSEDGTWERVPGEAFVRGSRSAVRMSVEGRGGASTGVDTR
ncbi:MAG: hypothetical protein AAB434_01995 [Planctomycetota bacterium]